MESKFCLFALVLFSLHSFAYCYSTLQQYRLSRGGIIPYRSAVIDRESVAKTYNSVRLSNSLFYKQSSTEIVPRKKNFISSATKVVVKTLKLLWSYSIGALLQIILAPVGFVIGKFFSEKLASKASSETRPVIETSSVVRSPENLKMEDDYAQQKEGEYKLKKEGDVIAARKQIQKQLEEIERVRALATASAPKVNAPASVSSAPQAASAVTSSTATISQTAVPIVEEISSAATADVRTATGLSSTKEPIVAEPIYEMASDAPVIMAVETPVVNSESEPAVVVSMSSSVEEQAPETSSPVTDISKEIMQTVDTALHSVETFFTETLAAKTSVSEELVVAPVLSESEAASIAAPAVTVTGTSAASVDKYSLWEADAEELVALQSALDASGNAGLLSNAAIQAAYLTLAPNVLSAVVGLRAGGAEFHDQVR